MYKDSRFIGLSVLSSSFYNHNDGGGGVTTGRLTGHGTFMYNL